MKNFAYIDIITNIMEGVDIDPSRILAPYKQSDLEEYRNAYTLQDSTFWVGTELTNKGYALDALAEHVAEMPKSTYYRRIQATPVTIREEVVGEEHLPKLKLLLAGLKHAKGVKFNVPDKRLAQLIYASPVHQDVEPPKVEEPKEEDEGFEF